jgi:hypothetical protein
MKKTPEVDSVLIRGRLLGSVVSGVMVLTGCASAGTPSPLASTIADATSSPSVQPTSSAGAKPTSLALTWSDRPFDGTVAAVAPDRGTLVAVSFDPEDRVAWSSTDGRAWAEDPVPDPAPSDCEFYYETRCFPNTAGMGQLVRLGDTLYSFGRTEGFNDYVRPVGWRLTDGQSWQAIQSQSEFYSYGVVSDAAASDDALVAATFNYAQYTSDVSRWMADTSWMATDLMGQGDSLLDVYDMAWSEGSFLAVGAIPEPIDGEGDWPTHPGMWTSNDGLRWLEAPPPGSSTSLCSVTATTKGFVAMGRTEAGMAAWTQATSDNWIRADLGSPNEDPNRIPVSPETCSVVELDNGLLAVHGLEESTETWTSLDGATWARGPTLDVTTLPDLVAALGNTVVLFGWPPGNHAEFPKSTLHLGTIDI